MKPSREATLDTPDIDDRPYMCDKEAMSDDEFKTRIANSTTLVIGADMKTYGDYSKWEKIDENYIGIRDWDNTWMRYNDNKLVDWNDEDPEEKYHGNIPRKKFTELVKSVLFSKKFRLIIVDGGTIQYIHDMETLFNLASNYIDPDDGLLIYPVSQQTKTFPTSKSLLDNSTNSFSCYNFENTDIPKLMRNHLDLVKFVNITFNHLGLCYVMKHKEGGGLPGDSKYIDLFRLKQLKNRSSILMATVNQAQIMKDQKFNEWQKKREELVIKINGRSCKISEDEKRAIRSCPPKKDLDKDDINNFLKQTYFNYGYSTNLTDDDIKGIRQEILKEKQEYDDKFKEIPEISRQTIISFTHDDKKTDSRTITLFKLIDDYESKEKETAIRKQQENAEPDYGDGGISSPRCISPALPEPSPPLSPTTFNIKSTRKHKSKRKSLRKPLRKPLQKSKSKSPRKSPRKPLRKPLQKSKRKSIRKSLRKPLRKPLQKSKRKSIRKPLRKSVRKSKRKSRR